MTDAQLFDSLSRAVSSERKITNRILRLINLAEDRRLHLERGYSSMHRFLVEEFKYSAAAANRRVQAARLLRAVPSLEEKLESGALNLTSLAQAQAMIRVQEKSAPVDRESILSQIENLNGVECAQKLFELLPENKNLEPQKIVAVAADLQRLSVNLTNDAMTDLQRATEILSHTIPDGDLGLVLARLFKDFVARHDPVLKKSKNSNSSAPAHPNEFHSATVSHRANRVQILRRDEGACTYRDPRTGKICGERFRVERDHIFPRAWGGVDSFANGRTLCRAHNQFMSEKILGRRHASRWRNRP